MKKEPTLKHLKGCKASKHREAVFDVIKKAQHPLTAEEIQETLKQQGKNTPLSTLYRNLDTLTSHNIISKTTLLDDKKARYELCTTHHKHYLVCSRCQCMIPIDACPLDKIINEISDKKHFKVLEHKFEIYGLCHECQN